MIKYAALTGTIKNTGLIEVPMGTTLREVIFDIGGDIELLEELADTISHTALCGLGKTAPSPVISTIKNFRNEYEAHIYEKRCPAGACSKLKKYVIDETLCKGCSKCARNCPAEAISGQIKSPFKIDQDKCIKCGACIGNCAFGAVKEEV